jgi:hypothetical protein
MKAHHVVLFALAAPIIGVGIVVWFLLPGSVSGLTYAPSQFDQDAILRPTYWPGLEVTLHGYVRMMPCSRQPCSTDLILSDTLNRPGRSLGAPDPARDVVLLPQRESGWHAFLRRVVPQLVSSPLGPADQGRSVTVTGRLVSGYSPGRVPVIQPDSL